MVGSYINIIASLTNKFPREIRYENPFSLQPCVTALKNILIVKKIFIFILSCSHLAGVTLKVIVSTSTSDHLCSDTSQHEDSAASEINKVREVRGHIDIKM